MAKQLKTPDYNRRAIDKYNEKFTRKMLRIPHMTYAKLEQIYGEGFSVNGYVMELIKKDLTEKGIEIE